MSISVDCLKAIFRSQPDMNPIFGMTFVERKMNHWSNLIISNRKKENSYNLQDLTRLSRHQINTNFLITLKNVIFDFNFYYGGQANTSPSK